MTKVAHFSQDGAPPRDILRRRVRVAEYHRIPWEEGVEKRSFAFYDEAKDSWQKFTWLQLYHMSKLDDIDETLESPGFGMYALIHVNGVDVWIGDPKPGLYCIP